MENKKRNLCENVENIHIVRNKKGIRNNKNHLIED